MNIPLTDEDLRMAVVKALGENILTRGLKLHVGVVNSVAHLSGSVSTYSLWELTQEIAGQVIGIRGVVNRIEAPDAPPPGRIINLDLPVNENDQITYRRE